MSRYEKYQIAKEKMFGEQISHAEELSGASKLVAEISHEINNPLMNIMCFSQLLMDMPGDKKLADIKDKLKKIYDESFRTTRIVQNSLLFIQGKKVEREYLNMNDILKHIVDLREYFFKADNIRIILVIDENLPRTMVNLFQIQQIFINIINNAKDAMIAMKGGRNLEIKTSCRGEMIEIVFKDDGPGIPKDIMCRVFDPFFTTKAAGKGTGLGLSITRDIAIEHGGTIDIASPDEGGATITVKLPVVEKNINRGLKICATRWRHAYGFFHAR